MQSAVVTGVAPFGGEKYAQALDLRDRVLRAPLGLSFSAADLAKEDADFHLVATQDERVIACLVLTPLSPDEVKMRQVAVEPDRQGQGIGRLLVEFSESFAAEQGFRRMTLNARDTAVPFYLSQGYELEGEPFVEVTIPHRRMAKSIARTN